ncbi:MAG: hypothetical protein ACLFWB_01985 [Armatimonadota bacterium]
MVARRMAVLLAGVLLLLVVGCARHYDDEEYEAWAKTWDAQVKDWYGEEAEAFFGRGWIKTNEHISLECFVLSGWEKPGSGSTSAASRNRIADLMQDRESPVVRVIAPRGWLKGEDAVKLAELTAQSLATALPRHRRLTIKVYEPLDEGYLNLLYFGDY